MICPKDNVEYEEGWLNNNAQNFGKGNPFGKRLAAKLGAGMPITALRCPKCGEVKLYTLENLQK